MANLGKVVYLTEAQAQELFANGSITVGGTTVTYSANDIYVTPTISGGLIAVQDQTPTDPNTQIWLPETQPQSVTLAELSDIPDVQINGTSIVSNGVANIPKASANIFGVVKPSGGIPINNDGEIYIQAADSTTIKNGTSALRAIAPIRQHESVFYGLTKAAGVDMASSANAVGTYTPEAKAAIWQMLSLDGSAFIASEWELIADVTTTENLSEFQVITDLNGNAFELSEMYVRAQLPASTTGGQDYMPGATYVKNVNGQTAWTSLSTLRYTSANSAAYFDYKFEMICGRCVLISKAATAFGNTQNAQLASFGELNSTSIDSICGIKWTQYSSTTSLIPSGTHVVIYGKRKRTALDPATITVSGSTPTITALPGHRYICGEVTELSITAPASGCIDVVFTSGTTPTVLTVTSAKANTTIKWANSFDPTSIDASTTYEINILDGEFGVAGKWT